MAAEHVFLLLSAIYIAPNMSPLWRWLLAALSLLSAFVWILVGRLLS